MPLYVYGLLKIPTQKWKTKVLHATNYQQYGGKKDLNNVINVNNSSLL